MLKAYCSARPETADVFIFSDKLNTYNKIHRSNNNQTRLQYMNHASTPIMTQFLVHFIKKIDFLRAHDDAARLSPLEFCSTAGGALAASDW